MTIGKMTKIGKMNDFHGLHRGTNAMPPLCGIVTKEE